MSPPRAESKVLRASAGTPAAVDEQLGCSAVVKVGALLPAPHRCVHLPTSDRGARSRRHLGLATEMSVHPGGERSQSGHLHQERRRMHVCTANEASGSTRRTRAQRTIRFTDAPAGARPPVEAGHRCPHWQLGRCGVIYVPCGDAPIACTPKELHARGPSRRRTRSVPTSHEPLVARRVHWVRHRCASCSAQGRWLGGCDDTV